MKFRLNTFAALTIAALTFTFAPIAHAQPAGLHYVGPLSGTPVRVLASSTNVFAIGLTSTNSYGLPGTTTNLVQNVSEFNSIGLTWKYGAGSNATLQVFKSFDGGLAYESLPSFSYSGPATSSTAFSTNASLDVTDVTHLAFVINNFSTLDLTNCYLTVNLKSPKRGAKQATQ